MDDLRSVAEDIEWFRDAWWLGQPDTLSSGDIRRASSTLRLLLVEGLVLKAWHYLGLEDQPKIDGPDVVALAAQDGLRLDLAAGVIAGGGRVRGVDAAFVGAFRVDNPATGMSADADSGFAVRVTCIARDATKPATPSPLDALVHRSWRLTQYLESVGAVRRGQLIKRREIIDYFRNYAGGSHHKFLGQRRQDAKRDRYELIAELERHLRADTRDGLHFELLSMGQAVGRSPDMLALATRIRAAASGKDTT